MARPLQHRLSQPGRSILPLAVAVAALSACNPEPGGVLDISTVATPAAPGSGEPNLTVGANGVVYLSWLEPTEAGHALKLATLTEDGWGGPLTVIDRPDLFVNWADFPSVTALENGVLVAHWLEKSGPDIYAYDVRMALSRDGGASWSDDIVPHRDGVAAEHGFVSLVPVDGSAAALWLDGRATVDGAPMTLRFTLVDASGVAGPEALVDASVCDCCQTAMAPTARGLVAVYRNRTADEVRDIYVARYTDGAWSEGRPVHEDGWVISGCPVNGPALDSRGDTVAVAWFTAADPVSHPATAEEIRAAGENGRVLSALSVDGGITFGSPVRVDDGAAMGRVDLVLLADGTSAVSWLERTAAGAEVRVRRLTPDGVGPAVAVTAAEAERATGFPRMTRVGNRLVFAWTVPGQAGGIQTAVAELPETWFNRVAGTP